MSYGFDMNNLLFTSACGRISELEMLSEYIMREYDNDVLNVFLDQNVRDLLQLYA